MNTTENNTTGAAKAGSLKESDQQAGEAASADQIEETSSKSAIPDHGENLHRVAEVSPSDEVLSSSLPSSPGSASSNPLSTTKSGASPSKPERRQRSLRSLKDQLRHLNFAETKSIRDWADNRLLTILHPEVRSDLPTVATDKISAAVKS